MTSAAAARANGDPRRLAIAMVMALALAGLPILLHLVAQPLAIAVCASMAVLVARLDEPDAPIIVLTVNIFQNVFVSLASPNFSDLVSLEPLKSYSFLTTFFVWLTIAIGFLQEWRSYSPFVKRTILASLAVLAVVGVYFVAGLAVNARNSIVYMRNIGQPILIFQMFLVVASKHVLALPSIVSLLLWMLSITGYLELISINTWLNMTNGWHLLELSFANRLTSAPELKAAQDSGIVITNLLDYMTTDFLNTSLLADWNLKVVRLQGPNLHPISFGYLLALLLSFAAVHQRKFIAVLSIPILLLTSAKGPLVLMIVCIGFCYLARERRQSDVMVWGLLLLLSAYAILAFHSGLTSGDYHVLGLLGGLNGFLRGPIGHTLGEGGNLSIENFAAIDWSKLQNEGAADLAVESAVGVLLYQMGVAAIVVFAFYLWLARLTWRLYRATGAVALAFSGCAVVVVLVNGLFQEEAYFAPLALGLALGFVGLSLGATDREVARHFARGDHVEPPPFHGTVRTAGGRTRGPHSGPIRASITP